MLKLNIFSKQECPFSVQGEETEERKEARLLVADRL